MDTITITETDLQNVADAGEKKASESLSKLSKMEVNVKTLETKKGASIESEELLKEIEEHMVVAYSQILTGVPGLSIIGLQRPEALQLVDIFNGRPKGTTVVMQEIDRSTIKETLNILANAYISELANATNTIIKLDVPRMITGDRATVISKKVIGADQKIILFKTALTMEKEDININLFFSFIMQEK